MDIADCSIARTIKKAKQVEYLAKIIKAKGKLAHLSPKPFWKSKSASMTSL